MWAQVVHFATLTAVSIVWQTNGNIVDLYLRGRREKEIIKMEYKRMPPKRKAEKKGKGPL